MSELYKRIDDLCVSNGVSITEMCRASGASRGSLTDLKNGRTNGLAPKTLAAISGYFQVSVDYLLGNEKKEPAGQKASGLDDSPYGQLSPENRKFIDDMIDKLLRSQSAE